MKTSKKLGIEVYRGYAGWLVKSGRGSSDQSIPNKGVAVLEFLKSHYTWGGKEWK
jgi:hypothetical protein